ncbi:hypothetical protein W97_00434 [Coniosporium apollinis CBS 100218]|uniref:RNA polymerase II holoenzyme cyclin-like subunit n=1 Tax=Coniosporium apollinis (strain CBS 100218) TaxID=1168221 RepID=R7YHV6_CONA1|nr:uncharacterized protein W97_00434 [Coniosporium apollinis CBS 100218]EON61221.1 hypothetical protein W97_00434 [Coniosporium apollinis CBS 100218]
MSASYWSSTQRRYWTFTKPELAELRRKLDEQERGLITQYPLPERRLLNIYFNLQIAKIGRRLQSPVVRQQCLATAQVYVRRFYTKVEIRRTNPYLVLATALYLACKVEEQPQHIRHVLGEACHVWPDFNLSDISKIGECEFTLISEMNSQLIIHHPYRSLADLQNSFPLAQDESALAWSVINDSFLTDLPLLHPPHIIAVTAMFLAVVLKPSQSTLQVNAAGVSGALQALSNPQAAATPAASSRMRKFVDWLADSSVDMEAVVDCTQELISLYELWETYNEKVCKEQIARFMKARGLDK